MSTTIEKHDARTIISGAWAQPVQIATTGFEFKSLSEWVVNTTIGCSHGCRFCYVPSSSANKQGKDLAKLGVDDPDAQWGVYVFLREWDEEVFLKSLRAAENRDEAKLKPEGHRAVMFCSTTDPYQVILNPDPKIGRELTKKHQEMVRRALELIRDRSTLNVRILTRSPLAKLNFDLMKSFGNRLLFGMSLPTLNDKLTQIFEPYAPGPLNRLETLQAAKEAGVNVYVAMAPTYPNCDEADIRATLMALKELEPLTIFHEPINIRAENVERIRAHAEKLGAALDLSAFADNESWLKYAFDQFQLVERIAEEVGVNNRLHLWPDKAFATIDALQSLDDPTGRAVWLNKWWTRISEWAH